MGSRTAGRVDAGRAGRHQPAGNAAQLVAIGGPALLVGVAVYLADRDPSRVALLPALPLIGSGHWFGAVGQWLPSLVHPFAFALFTVAALKPASRWRLRACAAWGAVDVAAEVGQHAALSTRLADAIHASIGHGEFADAVTAYFLRGTFDPLDIVAAMLGAIAAALVSGRLQSGARDAT